VSWNSPDVYSSPSHFGCEVLGTIQWTPSNYDFDLTIVLRDLVTGKLYWADDSGCSCPSPFEDCQSLDDCQTGGLESLQEHLQGRLDEARKDDWNDPWADVADLLQRAAEGISA
jgi:hypothetical protein